MYVWNFRNFDQSLVYSNFQRSLYYFSLLLPIRSLLHNIHSMNVPLYPNIQRKFFHRCRDRNLYHVRNLIQEYLIPLKVFPTQLTMIYLNKHYHNVLSLKPLMLKLKSLLRNYFDDVIKKWLFDFFSNLIYILMLSLLQERLNVLNPIIFLWNDRIFLTAFHSYIYLNLCYHILSLISIFFLLKYKLIYYLYLFILKYIINNGK